MFALNKSVENLKEIVSSINEKTFEKSFSLKLDCSTLPPSGAEGNCCTNPILQDFFKPLINMSDPVLYWFEICSAHTSKEIFDPFVSAKTNIKRTFPAHKQFSSNTSVLYVGKVVKDICGRMVVHLGYYEKPTQGLQLCYWAQAIGLKLQLNYIVLPKNLTPLITFFEKQLAIELNPLIGKH